MIYIGDAIAAMSTMKNDSYGAIVTSPPYNIGMDYGEFRDDMSDEEYSLFTKSWMREALRISPVAVVNYGARTSNSISLARFMIDCASVGVIQSHIIWAKSISTDDFSRGHFKPVNSQRYITSLHESIFVISRTGDHKLDRLSIGVPFSDKSNISRFKSNTGDVRCRGNIWLVPYDTKNTKENHPAVFPQKLAEMMIKLVAPASVLDPFIGSGTTAKAAETLGIPCDGIDIKSWS
jgi:site-specific DNA-methyltransferase (adenine-specific)